MRIVENNLIELTTLAGLRVRTSPEFIMWWDVNVRGWCIFVVESGHQVEVRVSRREFNQFVNYMNNIGENETESSSSSSSSSSFEIETSTSYPTSEFNKNNTKATYRKLERF